MRFCNLIRLLKTVLCRFAVYGAGHGIEKLLIFADRFLPHAFTTQNFSQVCSILIAQTSLQKSC